MRRDMLSRHGAAHDMTWWPAWLGALCGLLLLTALVRSASVVGDTQDLLGSLDATLLCLASGQWIECAAARKWAVLQYGPALVLRRLGLSLGNVGFTLSYLNIAAFVALLFVTWRTVRSRSRLVSAAAVLVLSSGVLVHYTNRSFGEILAAFLATAFAASWLRRRPAALVALLALLTTVSKESALPFVALLGAICAATHRAPGMPWSALLRAESSRLAGAGLGLAAGLALTVGANVFRFGLPYNVAYMRETVWAPSLPQWAEFFVALWIAPNAGLLFFWPLLVLSLSALPLAIWTRQRSSATPTDWMPLAGLELLLVTLTAFLAWWWAPFGWWAWGSRLIMPWMPAALLIAWFAYADAAEALVRPLVATPARATVVTLLVALVAMPHVSSIFQFDTLLRSTFVEHGVCPVPDSPDTHASYYRCIRAQAWEHDSPLLHAYALAFHPGARLPVLLSSVLVAVGGAWLWRLTCEGRDALTAIRAPMGRREGIAPDDAQGAVRRP